MNFKHNRFICWWNIVLTNQKSKHRIESRDHKNVYPRSFISLKNIWEMFSNCMFRFLEDRLSPSDKSNILFDRKRSIGLFTSIFTAWIALHTSFLSSIVWMTCTVVQIAHAQQRWGKLIVNVWLKCQHWNAIIFLGNIIPIFLTTPIEE